MELCGWGGYLASMYTYGVAVAGGYLPDLDHAGGILYWGYNPPVARSTHATSTVAALARGARLIVVDPRRDSLASKADHWLRVGPGTDAGSCPDSRCRNDTSASDAQPTVIRERPRG